jgi:hypothetical protein
MERASNVIRRDRIQSVIRGLVTGCRDDRALEAEPRGQVASQFRVESARRVDLDVDDAFVAGALEIARNGRWVETEASGYLDLAFAIEIELGG